MIELYGNRYRTLADEFYVNGSKVMEAYANGQKVYPDIETPYQIRYRTRVNFDLQGNYYFRGRNVGWFEQTVGLYSAYPFFVRTGVRLPDIQPNESDQNDLREYSASGTQCIITPYTALFAFYDNGNGDPHGRGASRIFGKHSSGYRIRSNMQSSDFDNTMLVTYRAVYRATCDAHDSFGRDYSGQYNATYSSDESKCINVIKRSSQYYNIVEHRAHTSRGYADLGYMYSDEMGSGNETYSIWNDAKVKVESPYVSGYVGDDFYEPTNAGKWLDDPWAGSGMVGITTYGGYGLPLMNGQFHSRYASLSQGVFNGAEETLDCTCTFQLLFNNNPVFMNIKEYVQHFFGE